MEQKIWLVIPCYNEEYRLDINAFIQFASENRRIIFWDDGSTDKTSQLIRRSIEKKPFLTLLGDGINRGKANAIFQAFTEISKNPEFNQNDWIGFWDADLATPLNATSEFLQYKNLYHSEAKALFGSRVLRLGAKIERLPLRHYLGRIFATLVTLVLKIYPYDSQCGAKLFHGSILNLLLQKGPFISKWVFDVEIILRLKDIPILEVPLSNWQDVPGSKVKISKEAFRVLKDLFKIKKFYN